ncbi:MAG: glycosyltransferase family 39 protein [Acidimicrobiales bacterium]
MITTTDVPPDLLPVDLDPPPGSVRRSRSERAARDERNPRWGRPALWALLLGTLVLYTWTLSESGWANSFYSAAVQAGSASWKAFFYGSSDAANSITVDKPPLALWPMALSVRLLGLSSFSILLPQALMGVGSVAVLHATVRRWFGTVAGLVAGAVLALTPVAALMFRFNNPDALLVLLMLGAAYAALRAIESGRLRWFVWTGVAVGLGFLTKQLQVLLVVPGFALAHLAFGGHGIWRRIRDLGAAAVAMIVAAGWWIAIVELVPASMRPYVGGSQHNSILELTFGYNGLGRLTGNETGSVGGGARAGGGSMWGVTGITRMFTSEVGGQISWLIPAALLLGAATLVVLRKAPRTDLRRASVVVWAAWLLVTGLVFSFMSGIFHAYYTVALAPAVAALVAIGVTQLWPHRRHWAALLTMGAVSAVSTWWSMVLLSRASTWHSWLSSVVLVVGGLATAGFLAAAAMGRLWGAVGTGRVAAASMVMAGGAMLLGPTAWTLQTVATGHTGSIVTAGPTVAGGMGGPGGGFPGGGFPGGGFPGGGFPGGTGTGARAGGGGMGGGGMGGLLNATTPSSELVETLSADSSDYTWIAAAVGANNASGYQLATELPVMPIGGFNGSDPSPTLAQFKQYVAEGRIHYFIGGGGFGGAQMGGSNSSAEISSWVQSNFTATTVGGTTLYDLTSATSSN